MPHDAAWIVYINGLEIPVMSVDVTFGVWKIPTASIQLIPHPILQRLGAEDRLHVVIFYKDMYYVRTPSKFRLLGEFEVVGWTYRNSPQGRAMQLDCVSPLQIFKQLHCFYMSSVDDIVAGLGPTGSAEGASQAKPFYPASLFLEGLFRSSDGEAANKEKQDEEEPLIQIPSDDFIKRPIDFILNLFKSVLSPVDFDPPAMNPRDAREGYVPQDATAVPGKNFFARWMLQRKLHAQWCALPMFEDGTAVPEHSIRLDGEPSAEQEAAAEESGHLCFPLVKAVQDYQVIEALQHQVGESVGNAGSIWDLLKMVYSHMYMELAMIPCPPTGRMEKGTANIATPLNSSSYFGIKANFVKPQCVFAIPPMCNVVFPSMLVNYAFQETYITQPTRLYLGEAFLSHLIDADSRLGGLEEQLLTTGFPPVVRNRMRQMITQTDENSKNFLVAPEELFKGPVSKRMNAPPWMYLLQQNMKGTSDSPGSKPTEEEQKALENMGIGRTSTGLGALFDKYAQYEYYRSRFMERQGGVSMVFNPYIVPGFPATIYDQRASGFDTVGYVMSVTHSMSSSRSGPHMNTQVNLSFMRTIKEMWESRSGDPAESLANTTFIADVYPPEPLPSVRDVFQQTGSAQEFYRMLFFGADYSADKRMLAWENGVIMENTPRGGATGILDKQTPSAEWESVFESTDAAMAAIARPVCTLEEYIEFYHQRTLDSLLVDGTVTGEYRSFYSATDSGDEAKEGAIFWGRIYRNTPMSEDYTPPDEVVNVVASADDASETAEGDFSAYGPAEKWRLAEPGDIPDTRRDWDAILEEYRKIVRGEEGKVAPQQ